MALTRSNGMPVGTVAPPFSLPATDGDAYSLADFRDAAVLVVVFTCNHCPYAIASEDRLIAMQKELEDRDVRFVLINPNDATTHPADNFERMVERAKDKSFPFPYLRDENQAVARAYDAACTPDPFVFDRDRRLVYNGRIDDSWEDVSRVTHNDLRSALAAALDGRLHTLSVKPAMGCSIKWKR